MVTKRLCRGLAAAGLALAVGPAGAASHREAPLMTLDPGADITDVYAFVSYDDANVARPVGERKVTLIHLNLLTPPTPAAQFKRLTILAHDAACNPTPDPAGFPNGRRPDDDVTDLVVRVAGGDLYVQNRVGDGVGIQEKGVTPEFPFLPTPYDGRDRKHRDPGE